MTCRKHVGDTTISDIPHKICRSSSNDTLTTFLEWCQSVSLSVSPKVCVCQEGSCAKWGMLATQDITKGETLFTVPRLALLTPATCSIAELLKEESSSLKSLSGWVPLLLALMYEYNNANTKWRPYFDICLHTNEKDLPMFWTEDERTTLLEGTDIAESVKRDLANMESDYTKIVKPFICKHSQVFGTKTDDFDLFKSMVAFIMSYSFTEPAVDEEAVASPPIMVPMADILNHIATNNANLEFEKDCLKMVATANIKKGQEVYNTYGPSTNSELLHMYGFAEEYPNNHYDTVNIPMTILLEASVELDLNSTTLLQEKKTFMEGMDLLTDDVVVGVEGVVYPDDMTTILKVLAMSKSDFAEFREKDGWSSSEEDEHMDEESLLFKNMKSRPQNWKSLLSWCAKKSLKSYSPCIDEDVPHSSNRHRFAFYTSYGQKKLLNMVVDSCEPS